MTANDTKDVSNVKGVRGGYGFSGPAGTTVGTGSDPFAALGSAFDNMGFITNDGVEESADADTEEVVDINGDVIFVAKSKETETLALTLASLTAAALAEQHGHANVDDSNASYTKVTHMTTDHEARCYVFDFLLKDGRRWRKVVPNGMVTAVGSVVHGSGSVAARQITLSCMPDSAGARMYDYIEKAASTSASGS